MTEETLKKGELLFSQLQRISDACVLVNKSAQETYIEEDVAILKACNLLPLEIRKVIKNNITLVLNDEANRLQREFEIL